MSSYYLNKDALLSNHSIFTSMSWCTAHLVHNNPLDKISTCKIFWYQLLFYQYTFKWDLIWGPFSSKSLQHLSNTIYMCASVCVCVRERGRQRECARKCHSELWHCRCLNCGDVIGHKGNRNKSFTVLDLIPWLLISQSASNRNNCHM